MTGLPDHLIIVPILLPLVSGAVMLLLDERHRIVKGAIGVATTFALLIVSIILLRQADLPPVGPDGSAVTVYQLGNWPAPFGIVLVVDRLSALMLVLTSVLGLAVAAVFARPLASRGAAVPHALSASAHGAQRRLPDRRSVQPLRVLRGAARRLVRPRPARGRDRPGQGGSCLHRHQPHGVLSLPDRCQFGLRRHRHAQHGGPRQAHSRPRPWRCRAHGDRGGGARHHLPDEGGGVAAQLLASDNLCGRLRTCGRDVRNHEQARHLRDPAPLDAGIRPGGGSACRIRRSNGCWSVAC